MTRNKLHCRCSLFWHYQKIWITPSTPAGRGMQTPPPSAPPSASTRVSPTSHPHSSERFALRFPRGSARQRAPPRAQGPRRSKSSSRGHAAFSAHRWKAPPRTRGRDSLWYLLCRHLQCQAAPALSKFQRRLLCQGFSVGHCLEGLPSLSQRDYGLARPQPSRPPRG